jgi:hypothetical protein
MSDIEGIYTEAEENLLISELLIFIGKATFSYTCRTTKGELQYEKTIHYRGYKRIKRKFSRGSC